MPSLIRFSTGPETGRELPPAQGYLAQPAVTRTGVIVVQEWWGLVPHIQDVARRFAALGFVALAPDLYHGKSTVDAEEATHLMKGLNWAQAEQEIAGAAMHLRQAEDCTHVAIVGFCMGGALATIAASQPGIDAYAAFYGFPPKGSVDLEKITAPGLLFFGESESFFSVPDAKAFAKKQRERGIATEVIEYEGAGHAFFNDARPEAYRRNAACDAWTRTLALFGSLQKSV